MERNRGIFASLTDRGIFPLVFTGLALCLSGVTGFGSFLLYIGYGYLDHWHGAATLALIPVYLIGILKSRKQTKGAWSIKPSLRIIRQSFRPVLSALCLLL